MDPVDLPLASVTLGWLATFLVHSTLWIGGAWLLARRIESAAWRERLWRGSIAGGLLTSALVMALPDARMGWRWEMPVSEVQATSSARPARDVSPTAAEAPASSIRESQAASTAAPATSAPDPRPTARGGWSWNRIQLVLLALWLVGAALSIAQFAWAHLRLAGLLRSRRSLSDHPLMPSLAHLAARAGLARPPSLSTSSSLPAPVALARGEIVVPERALARLGSAELESLLGHELAHLARRDPWWLLALNVLRRVLWLQPLLSLATARAIEAAEMRCDELAARWTRGELALARCLAEVATWIEGRPPSRLLAGMAQQPSALVERVERLLSPRPVPRAQGALVATWLIGMLSVLACAGPKSGPTPTPGSKNASATKAPSETSEEPMDQLRTLGYVFGDQSAEVKDLASKFDEEIDEKIEQLQAEIHSKMEEMFEALDATGETPDHLKQEILDLLHRVDELEHSRSDHPYALRLHRLWLHRDGSIVGCERLLVPAGSAYDALLIEHLRAIPGFRYLNLQVDGQASYALLHRVLKASAAPDVGIVRFGLAVDGGPLQEVESITEANQHPNSIGIGLFVAQASPTETETRRVRYQVNRWQYTLSESHVDGVIGLQDLASLEAKLREFRSDGFDYPVLIDAAPEALACEVVAVCDLARRVGYQRIQFAVAAEDR